MADSDTEKAEAQYAPPASQAELAERLDNGNRSNAILSTSEQYVGAVEGDDEGRDYAVEGNDISGYLGVSPEYATYANETEAPLTDDEDGEENPENLIYKSFAERMAPLRQSVESQEEADAKAEEGQKSAQRQAAVSTAGNAPDAAAHEAAADKKSDSDS